MRFGNSSKHSSSIDVDYTEMIVWVFDLSDHPSKFLRSL